MFFTNRTKIEFREFVVGCSIGLLLTAFGSSALAGDNTTTSAASYKLVGEGSRLTHRSNVDGDPAQVYIYSGGTLPIGTNLLEFKYLFDTMSPAGTTSGYITPLLFERTAGETNTVYTVVGIGRGFEVALNSAPQTIPFEVIEGLKVPQNDYFTFGFTNAIVNLSGVSVLTSPGAVDFGQPADAGEGVSGTGSTNDWAATATSPGPSPVVALGTTFSTSGADYSFWPLSRTYSGLAIGAIPNPQ
jgi:hypothetical protein